MSKDSFNQDIKKSANDLYSVLSNIPTDKKAITQQETIQQFSDDIHTLKYQIKANPNDLDQKLDDIAKLTQVFKSKLNFDDQVLSKIIDGVSNSINQVAPEIGGNIAKNLSNKINELPELKEQDILARAIHKTAKRKTEALTALKGGNEKKVDQAWKKIDKDASKKPKKIQTTSREKKSTWKSVKNQVTKTYGDTNKIATTNRNVASEPIVKWNKATQPKLTQALSDKRTEIGQKNQVPIDLKPYEQAAEDYLKNFMPPELNSPALKAKELSPTNVRRNADYNAPPINEPVTPPPNANEFTPKRPINPEITSIAQNTPKQEFYPNNELNIKQSQDNSKPKNLIIDKNAPYYNENFDDNGKLRYEDNTRSGPPTKMQVVKAIGEIVAQETKNVGRAMLRNALEFDQETAKYKADELKRNVIEKFGDIKQGLSNKKDQLSVIAKNKKMDIEESYATNKNKVKNSKNVSLLKEAKNSVKNKVQSYTDDVGEFVDAIISKNQDKASAAKDRLSLTAKNDLNNAKEAVIAKTYHKISPETRAQAELYGKKIVENAKSVAEFSSEAASAVKNTIKNKIKDKRGRW